MYLKTAKVDLKYPHYKKLCDMTEMLSTVVVIGNIEVHQTILYTLTH